MEFQKLKQRLRQTSPQPQFNTAAMLGLATVRQGRAKLFMTIGRRRQMRLSFHIGVHKTGTTLIQNNLLKNINALRRNGVFYVNAEFPEAITRQRDVLRQMQNPARTTPPEDRLQLVNEKIVRQAKKANAHTILMSEENRIGFPLYKEMAKVGTPAGFYPQADECLRRVLFGMKNIETRLIVYRREFNRLLPSLYSEGLRNLILTETMDEFCQKIDFSSLDYGALFNRIAAGAPDAETFVKKFSRIRSGGESFLKEFVESAGINSDGFNFTTQLVRESVDEQGADELRQLAKRRAEGGMNKDIRQARNEILARSSDSSSPIKLPDWVTDRLVPDDQTA